jgi:uncharacterized protein
MPSRKTLVLAAAFAMILGAEAASAAPTAQEIMKRDFLASRVGDSTQDATFRLVNAQGQERVRETTGQTKLLPGTPDNRRVIVFDSPADIRGTKTLLIEHSSADDDIWIYLPAMKKVRRLVASNKKDSFVGTDFSYGDVIGHKVEDWNHALVREERLGPSDCWVIESTPRTPQVADTSGYSRRISWIDKRSYVALRTDIFDVQGAFLKRLTQDDVREVDVENHRWQPMRLVAENAQTSHKTIIELRNFKANRGVSDAAFTPQALEN